MKRNGFTMVELIFVIIIIGILSVAAIPKFGDIKDRAKVATEYSALSALDSAIEGALEFQREDFDNILVDWHSKNAISGSDAASLLVSYKAINTDKGVLKKLIKKGDNLKIVAYGSLMNKNIDGGTTDDHWGWDDLIFIKGKASDKSLGVKEADTIIGGNGKPDMNDFWAFNASPKTVSIYHFDGKKSITTTLESGEIKLIDNDAPVTDITATTQAGATTGKIGVNNGSAVTLTKVDTLL